MELPTSRTGSAPRAFRLGPWRVAPDRGELADGSITHRLEPKVMDVLLALVRHAGAVVTKQQLVDEVWGGRPVTDEVIARCISALRTQLGDDHRHPRYIETLPRRGYRLVMQPGPAGIFDDSPPAPRAPGWRRLAIAVALAMAVAVVYVGLTRLPEPSAAIESVAVLPFANLSSPADQYLADGVSEELTQALAQLDGLRVAARTSAFRFRGRVLDIREVARQLEVDGIVEGSVRRAGDDLRVTAQFVDGRSGFHLWAETFDGSAADVFELQERVAVRIRDTIGRRAGTDLSRARSEPASAEAYDLYLRGRHALSRRGAASLEAAVGLFRRSIELDPAYGPSYLELATAYALLPSYSDESAETMYDAALATMEVGLTADGTIAEAASALHGYVHNKRGHWLAADHAFQAALRAPQSSSLTHQWYSNLLASVGRLDDARAQAVQARRLDPLSPVVISRLAITSLWVDDNDAATEQFELANEFGMDTQLHRDSYLLLLLRKRDLDRIRVLTRPAATESTPAWIDAFLRCVAGDGDCNAAIRVLAAEPGVSPRVRIVAAAVMNDLDTVAAVARQLEKDIDAFETELLFIAELARFRADPRFEELTERIGLRDYWRAAGCHRTVAGIRCDTAAVSAGRQPTHAATSL